MVINFFFFKIRIRFFLFSVKIMIIEMMEILREYIVFLMMGIVLLFGDIENKKINFDCIFWIVILRKENLYLNLLKEYICV